MENIGKRLSIIIFEEPFRADRKSKLREVSKILFKNSRILLFIS